MIEREMIDREGRARRQQRLAALVELAGEPRPAAGIDREQDARELILDQRPLLLDHQDFLGAGTGVADEIRIERPGHADAAKTDAEFASIAPHSAQAVRTPA